MKGLTHQLRQIRSDAADFGWGAAFQLRLHDTVLRHLEIGSNFDLYLKVKGVDHPLRMRTGKSSDRGVLRQIFTNREYESVQLTDPLTIIDLGANVGYSSAYFLSRYPGAKVVSIEPDPSNFKLLQQNLAPYATRSLVRRAAVWSETRRLSIKKGEFGDGREWSTQVAVPGETNQYGYVQGYDLDHLISLANTDKVDLLKIDIERSEIEVFSHNTAWLSKVKNICIELHDDECSNVFFSAMSEYSYDVLKVGDLTICSHITACSGRKIL